MTSLESASSCPVTLELGWVEGGGGSAGDRAGGVVGWLGGDRAGGGNRGFGRDALRDVFAAEGPAVADHADGPAVGFGDPGGEGDAGDDAAEDHQPHDARREQPATAAPARR